MNTSLVTVFGGSGFVGKNVVRALVKQGWRVRVAMRRPHTGQDLKVIGNVGQVQLVQANTRFKNSVRRAVDGADAVVNLTGILFEQGRQTFETIHIRGAETIAEAAADAGVSNYVHMSAIGADVEAESAYARSKGEGEQAVREALPQADILRPSIVFGPEDDFFNRFAALSTLSPVMPLIGGGETRFQPVYAGDVAEAIAKVLGQGTSGQTYELGGPHIYSFRELMQFTLETVNRKRILLPVPWVAASALGLKGELLGLLPFVAPFLTRDQVTSLKSDNVVADDAMGLQALNIKAETLEAIMPPHLERYRRYGQFHEREA